MVSFVASFVATVSWPQIEFCGHSLATNCCSGFKLIAQTFICISFAVTLWPQNKFCATALLLYNITILLLEQFKKAEYHHASISEMRKSFLSIGTLLGHEYNVTMVDITTLSTLKSTKTVGQFDIMVGVQGVLA